MNDTAQTIKNHGIFLKASKHLMTEFINWQKESTVEYIVLYGKMFYRNQINNDFMLWLEMQRASKDDLKIRYYEDPIEEETPVITEDYTFADYELVN
jgi:hypothetical protein